MIEEAVRDALIAAFREVGRLPQQKVSQFKIDLFGDFPETKVSASFQIQGLGAHFLVLDRIWDEPGYLAEIGPARYADYMWLSIEELLNTSDLSRMSPDVDGKVHLRLD